MTHEQAKKYRQRAYRVARTWGRTHEESEDFSQEVILKMLAHPDGHQTVQQSLIDISRIQRLYNNRFVITDPQDQTTKWFQASTSSTIESLIDAETLLNSLGVEDRVAAKLCWAYDYDQRDAAIVLGCDESAVSHRLKKLKRTLRKHI